MESETPSVFELLDDGKNTILHIVSDKEPRVVNVYITDDQMEELIKEMQQRVDELRSMSDYDTEDNKRSTTEDEIFDKVMYDYKQYMFSGPNDTIEYYPRGSKEGILLRSKETNPSIILIEAYHKIYNYYIVRFPGLPIVALPARNIKVF